jgi:hypothetical protein
VDDFVALFDHEGIRVVFTADVEKWVDEVTNADRSQRFKVDENYSYRAFPGLF